MKKELVFKTENYLNTHYKFRMNTIKSIDEIAKVEENIFTPINEKRRDALTVELNKNDIDINPINLKTILNSDFVIEYNPFKSYFESLKLKWDGKDHVKKLASTVKTDNDEFWLWGFRIWLRATVASVLEEGKYNEQILIFTGEQGVGKTTWLRKLLPEKLKGYMYNGVVRPGDKDSEIHLAQNFLVVLDELTSFNKKTEQALKAMISNPMLKTRLAYRADHSEYSRVASLVGSTNDKQFLNDQSGNRRYFINNVLGVDRMMLDKIDFDQVYAQAMEEYLNNKQYFFDEAGNTKLNEQNAQFQKYSVLQKLLLTYFEPGVGADTILLTPTEIADYLTDKKKSYIEPNSIGKALSALNFPKKRKNLKGNQAWPVKQRKSQIILEAA
jgi:predicted P-loop ATPase